MNGERKKLRKHKDKFGVLYIRAPNSTLGQVLEDAEHWNNMKRRRNVFRINQTSNYSLTD